MKKWITRFFLLCLILIISGTVTAAHEIYLAIEEEIEVGHPTEIKLYWGHFPATPDQTNAYYSEVPAGRFHVLSPDGKETEVALTDKGEYYSAVFVPTQAGDHWAIFSHDRGIMDWTHSEPQGRQQVILYSKALLDVHGENETVAFSRVTGHDLEVLPLVDGGHLHAGEEYRAQLLYFGKPLIGVSVNYYGPGDVGGETLTGPGGTFSFTPDAEGEWLVKVSYFDDNRKGQDAVGEYMGIRYTSTILITPHAHAENGISPAKGYLNYLLAFLTAALAFGAIFFFRKTEK